MEWKPQAGKKPAKKLLEEASTLARDGTKTQIVIAMALRPTGVTQHEIEAVMGHPYRNIIKHLVRSRKVKQVGLPNPDNERIARIKLIKR